MSVSCFEKVEDIVCQNTCQKPLACGHICKGMCYDCLDGSLHVACKEICEKVFKCGHKCKKLCGEYCGICIEKCEKFCACGTTLCSKRCFQRCDECPNKSCIPYEGDFSRFYAEFCDRMPYKSRCQMFLQCRKNKHQCCGLLDEKCPTYCWACKSKKRNEEAIIMTLDCSHTFDVSTMDDYVINYVEKNPNLINKTENIPCRECKQPIGKILRYQDYSNFLLMEIRSIEDLVDLFLSKVRLLSKQLNEFLEIDIERLVNQRSPKNAKDFLNLTCLLFNFDQKIKASLAHGHLMALKTMYPIIFQEKIAQDKKMKKIIKDYSRMEEIFFNYNLEIQMNQAGWNALDVKINDLEKCISVFFKI